MKIQTLGVIPARYGAQRFPGKPLALIAGKSLVQRVYEQATKANRLDKVVVATEDPTDLVTMEEVERRYIQRVTEAVGQNKTQAAKVLGFDRTTLYRKLERYKLGGGTTPAAKD